MQTDLEFTLNLAHRAGKLLCNYFSSMGINAQRKADNTVVTQADIAADQLITDAIQETYPTDAIISEENQTTLEAENHSTWVIDPLDGTTNFSLGFHIWGISIAHLINGWPSIGVVYFPLLDECYSAKQGNGAFLNGAPLSPIPQGENDQRQKMFTCCARTHRDYIVSVPYKKRILGSATYNLCSVARGAAAVSFDTVPKIWDVAAAWLIVEEAGGAITSLSHNAPFPILPGKDFATLHYPTLGAITDEILTVAQQQLQPRTAHKHTYF